MNLDLRKFTPLVLLLILNVSISQAFAADLFNENLFLGSRGQAVRQLQAFLILRGYLSSWAVTGYYGRLTFRAVKQYQSDRKLPSTGYFGPLTRTAVNREIQNLLIRSNSSLPAAPLVEKPALVPLTARPELKESSGFRLHQRPIYNLIELAHQIQRAINDERLRQGLPVLEWRDELARVALNHSSDQVADNVKLTDPTLPCHYPIIRHEDFTYGFTLKDRLDNAGVIYRLAAENIALVPLTKNLIYQYPAEKGPAVCQEIERFIPGEGNQEERLALYQKVLTESLIAVSRVEPVDWVNREWMTTDEITSKVINGWLNSPGHRRNMLNISYRRGGIGIVPVNNYLIITHVLAD
jgi:uncharacterized protein YkwD